MTAKRSNAPTGSMPTVAIVGRPNVGKSTLMNRIVGRRVAIVEERPGVTRDRKELEAEWRGRTFRLVDTGGWMASGSELDDKVSRQSERAVAEADLVLFLTDASVGLTEEDARAAEVVRRTGRPVIVAANKVDSEHREAAIWEFLGLGLGDPVPISALHGRGTGDLLDQVVDRLDLVTDNPAGSTESPSEAGTSEAGTPEFGSPEAETGAREGAGAAEFSVALVGRPNVGKSTLFNRLIGDERSVVHDMPGTTRDSVDTVCDTELGRIRFVDTAGMRRRARIDENTEWYSTIRALRSVDEADVALLVIDANEGITHQDQRLAERIDGAGCPIVVLLNKWETLGAERREQVSNQVAKRLAFLGESPVLRISALTGRGVQRLFPALEGAVGAYRTRVPTAKVNSVIRAAQQSQPAPHGARVLYATQGATDPPTFTLFANKEVAPHYLRYLERRLREDLGIGNTPIKLRVRRRTS